MAPAPSPAPSESARPDHGLSDPRFATIAEHLAEDRLHWRLPGLAGVLVVDGRVAWSGGLGRIDDAGTPAGPASRWRVGAVAQPVLASAMGRLAEAGVLSMEDPLARWIPEAAALEADGPPITLADCASHASGLPPMPAMSPDALTTLRFPEREELLAALADTHVEPELRGRFSYSSLAWALLAEALGRAAGRPITDYATEEILRPLGMASSGWPIGGGQPTGGATGYDAFGDPPTAAPTPRLGAFAPLWGLWTSASDMERFLAWQLRSQEGDRDPTPADVADGASPTSRETLRLLQSPRVVETERFSGATPGWLVGLTEAGPTLFHGGADPGFAAYTALQPKLGLAAFLAANRASNPEALGEMVHGVLGLACEVLGRS